MKGYVINKINISILNIFKNVGPQDNNKRKLNRINKNEKKTISMLKCHKKKAGNFRQILFVGYKQQLLELLSIVDVCIP